MRAVLKLRWMKLREDGKLMAFMTVLTFIMIAVFASIDYVPEEVSFGFVDEDQTPISQRLYKALDDLEGYRFVAYSLEEAEIAVKEEDVRGAFYIQNGFTAAIETGQVNVDKLLVSENMDNMQMDNLLVSSLNRVLQEHQLSNVLISTINANGTGDDKIQVVIDGIVEEHWTYKKPVDVTATTVKDEEPYSAIKHSIVGFSLFFAMFTIVFGIGDILVEKEQHTWQRQLISPISKFSLLSGNMIGVFFLGFVQVSAMFLVSNYLFKVDWAGNMMHLLIVIAAFVFCVTSLGMMISNFVSTIGQLSAISPVLITGTAMLGGCFWPLEIVTSKILLGLSMVTPQRWAISAIEKIVIHNYSLNEVIMNVVILTAMGLVYLLAGTYLLEKKTA